MFEDVLAWLMLVSTVVTFLIPLLHLPGSWRGKQRPFVFPSTCNYFVNIGRIYWNLYRFTLYTKAFIGSKIGKYCLYIFETAHIWLTDK